MPKAFLVFKLPEEDEEHKHALRGPAYHGALWDMDQYLRGRLKYEEGLSEEVREALQAARNHLTELTRGFDD